MDKFKLLKQEFQNTKIKFGKDIIKYISTKTKDGVLFPPYIPLIGKNYEKFRILFYGTSQNIGLGDFLDTYRRNFSKLVERLYYSPYFKRKYPNDFISYKDIAINPYRTGVIPALLGVFIYAKFGEKIEDLNKIIDWVSVTNYYKFSLNTGTRDINPESLSNYIKDAAEREDYWNVNNDLVEKEIKVLMPKYILSFNGRKIGNLKNILRDRAQIIEVNDPSWILHGGSGLFKEGKRWYRKAKECKEQEINRLIDHYLSFITGNYQGKKESVGIYLINYYCDWRSI